MDKPITDVEVPLNMDGNAFAILGTIQRAMRKAKVDESIVKEYVDEATSSDYDHLLMTTVKYVTLT